MLAQIQAMFAVVDLGKINWNQFLEKYLIIQRIERHFYAYGEEYQEQTFLFQLKKHILFIILT